MLRSQKTTPNQMGTIILSKVALLLVLALFSQPLLANGIQVARQYIPDAQAVGQIRMSYLFWNVYDATLYASKGRWSEGQPLALSLRYLMDLQGEAVAARSIEEMRKQGFRDEVTLARWYEQMKAIFPDVDKQTEITGVRNSAGQSLFYRNGQLIGKIAERQFGVWFFNIWLGENTSEPKLRRQLLGMQ